MDIVILTMAPMVFVRTAVIVLVPVKTRALFFHVARGNATIHVEVGINCMHRVYHFLSHIFITSPTVITIKQIFLVILDWCHVDLDCSRNKQCVNNTCGK